MQHIKSELWDFCAMEATCTTRTNTWGWGWGCSSWRVQAQAQPNSFSEALDYSPISTGPKGPRPQDKAHALWIGPNDIHILGA